jgi:IS1 family transposase
VKHIPNCTYHTDSWSVFAEVLPQERHVIGKSGTHTIERDNSNTRHHLGRFTRRTKIVSKSKEMVDITIRMWAALTTPAIFAKFQSVMSSIFE